MSDAPKIVGYVPVDDSGQPWLLHADYTRAAVLADPDAMRHCKERNVAPLYLLPDAPFGFTREDSRFLLWVAAARLRASDGAEADKIRALAARIEALLPPEAQP